mmetsp:Transcript_97768/g.119758  ORF Transcript_97768/g.119758 Transcript_97768/m.119758 type:complete len:103 (-) Transcript_97768:16-324(-)
MTSKTTVAKEAIPTCQAEWAKALRPPMPTLVWSLATSCMATNIRVARMTEQRQRKALDRDCFNCNASRNAVGRNSQKALWAKRNRRQHNVPSKTWKIGLPMA